MSRTRPDARQRRLVYEGARGCCEYCGAQERFSNAPFEVEHIIPLAAGGRTILDNLALSCGGCNRYKSDRTLVNDPITGRAVALFNPRRQLWDGHFAWEADYTRLAGLTPTGRASIVALRMNREQLCNLRWALRRCGQHPLA